MTGEEIEFFTHIWVCPECERHHRVRHGDAKIAQCCGRKFEVETRSVKQTQTVLVITSVYELD